MNLGKKRKERKKETRQLSGQEQSLGGGAGGLQPAQGVCSGAAEEAHGRCQSRGQRALGLDLLSKHEPGVQGSEAG